MPEESQNKLFRVAQNNSYIERIFLNIVIVLVVAGGASTPEAVLTEIVVVAALTFVAQAGE